MLNFQRFFARAVWEGTKRQTIRSAGNRRDVPKVGDVAHCFTGLRTRQTIKLGAWPIVRVDVLRMRIGSDGSLKDVIVGAGPLAPGDRAAFAEADGFGNWNAMQSWFCSAHPPQEFYGWVVHWDWSLVPGVVLPFEKSRGQHG